MINLSSEKEQELISKAKEIESLHQKDGIYTSHPIYNESCSIVGYEQVFHQEYKDTLIFTGEIRKSREKQELYPNVHNIALMDVCKVSYYEGKFINYTRKINGKRIIKSEIWYYIGEDIERLEIGSYYNQD